MLNLLMAQLQDTAERTITLHYKITVKEYPEESWSDWFEYLTNTHAEDAATTLPDRSATKPHSTASLPRYGT